MASKKPVSEAPETVEAPSQLEEVIVPEKHTLIGGVCQFCGTSVICPINGESKRPETI